MKKQRRDLLRDINFRQLVKACAVDHDVVAQFNGIHGLNLRCPIQPLVDPVFPLTLSEEEMLHIAWFVAWIQHNHWQCLRGATADWQGLVPLRSVELAARASYARVGKKH
jgi:hypothetical protein